MGNPARSVGGVCRCGALFTRFTQEQAGVDRESACPKCSLRYRVTGIEITELNPPEEPPPPPSADDDDD
jgi:UDP-2-acetamido-3-amino-2,3-dideoxy-glucuronate N-acetyltransferase